MTFIPLTHLRIAKSMAAAAEAEISEEHVHLEMGKLII